MMFKYLIACAALLAALTAGAAWSSLPAAKTTGCCAEGAECCYPGSPCCEGGCCYEDSPCCFGGSPCCEGGGDCCFPGSACCFPGSPCCDGGCCAEGASCCSAGAACCAASPVSADAPKGGKPAAGGKGCCGKCSHVKADAPARPAANATVIAVEDMECPSCAKKIVAKVSAVAGVAKVVADTKASKLVVTPRDKAAPSARAMWEAVVKAGFKPTRLEGPAGKFTAAPKE